MEDLKHMWKLLFGGKVTETLDNCAKCITNLDTCIYRTGGVGVVKSEMVAPTSLGVIDSFPS